MTTTMPPRSRTHRIACVRALAFGVEVGIGLVEHHQEGIAVERASQRDALALPGRERRSAFADLGVVAVRELAGSSHARPAAFAAARTSLGSALRLEAGDVLRHRAGEQLHVLGQIADARAELIGIPLLRAPRRRGELCRAKAARLRRACAPATTCPRRSGR